MPLESNCLTQTLLEIRSTPKKGRGVFATRPIAAGELIERAPVLVVPAKDWHHVDKSVFYDYLFAWGDYQGDVTALVLGYGSIYNHSYAPLAYYVKDYDSLTVDFFALRLIEAGEEITINYNCDPKCKDPLWFEVSSD